MSIHYGQREYSMQEAISATSLPSLLAQARRRKRGGRRRFPEYYTDID